MALTINPVLPVLSTKEVGSVAPDLVLQPGSVINAQVLKVLSADLVRIAISSLSIDVLSEVPLEEGQALQLAVSQTKDGIRLAMVGQGDATADAVTLSADALLDAAANPSTTSQPRNVLTPVERAAVANAAQNAATVQQSLAPLFANLGALAAAGNLPPRLQQAIAQVLAQQTRLDQNLDGGDIKKAFERSGLLFEASLAAGTGSSTAGARDLKAALIVLRQTLQSALGTAPAAPPASTAAGQVAAHPVLEPSLAPSDLDVEEILLPQARVPVADDLVMSSGISRGTSNASAGAALNLLQEFGSAARPSDIAADVTVHTNTPPPPFRGSLPTAQPVASPSIAPDMPLAAAAHHLLGDTDAALARQTLLQVASLPDRIDPANPQIDTSSPRWHFEIPFATPQGAAMAQFEISRDGGGVEAEAAKRVWRARFSIDVEPAGPVHALISLIGDRTSVRMWAERPATAAQLRAGAPQLSQALSRAELLPGDIVIQDGAPPQATPARAGHFLDRAL
ncbi:flagellar hook-length control protein FliK [Bradyrhizobium cenepequi]|uniref:flagellar hook-length control protein FliK n=1 Tax=Bradyrhizobium cenepequi TaxID=2821403 RepID=UPI001CE39877|nr:flagellar hook-length control protein FliK [Bradyrhizobium cenepequi]MCA6109531.1 flagellar hook-length control protein FliK [Bradyrhizobium cenepequi]